MRSYAVPNAVLCGAGPRRFVGSNRRCEVAVAALVKQTLRLRRFMVRFCRQTADSLGFCEQSAHFF